MQSDPAVEQAADDVRGLVLGTAARKQPRLA
jgi:hypothetical protein